MLMPTRTNVQSEGLIAPRGQRQTSRIHIHITSMCSALRLAFYPCRLTLEAATAKLSTLSILIGWRLALSAKVLSSDFLLGWQTLHATSLHSGLAFANGHKSMHAEVR